VGAQPSFTWCATGQEVIDFLEGRAPFDDRSKFPFPKLLLMDLNMPLMGGLEVLAWLQERPERQQLRVVILSGSAAPADIKELTPWGPIPVAETHRR